VAVVLEWLIDGSEFIVEELEELDNLTGIVQSLIQVAGFGGELVVQVRNSGLAQSINDTESLPRNANTIIDVESGNQGSQKCGEKRHVLGLIGGRAGNKTKTQIFSQSKSNIVVRDEASVCGVVCGSNVGNKGAGDSVEERELI
jgi:ribosome biogenesis SPOUT family RNA methylase Rps3